MMFGVHALHKFIAPTLILFLGCACVGCGGAAAASSSSGSNGGSTGNGSGGTTSDPSNYGQNAKAAVAVLQAWYSQSTGLYASPSGWWNAANSMSVLVNYAKVTGDTSYNSAIANTFTAAQKSHANFIDNYYDDQLWWALAWIDAYDLTGTTTYLSMAETIFANVATNAWDTTTCGGGVWWNTAETSKNTIPNELFLKAAAELANRTTGTASAGYLSWAQKEWAWIQTSGMINSENLVNGTASSNPDPCNYDGTTWTYNQGVIVGGLVELYRADQDSTLLPEAEAIASATMSHLVVNGILKEPVGLSGGDTPQFKGIFMRNLMELYEAVPAASTQASQYKSFAEANAQSIWTNNRSPDNELGGLWQGPFDSADATRQTSALDALIAADAMQ